MAKQMGAKVLMAAITNYVPESEHKSYLYGTYRDLCYKAVTGKTARQLRKELGLGAKASVHKLLTDEQLKRLNNYQYTVAGMLAMDMSYEEIKAKVLGGKEG